MRYNILIYKVVMRNLSAFIKNFLLFLFTFLPCAYSMEGGKSFIRDHGSEDSRREEQASHLTKKIREGDEPAKRAEIGSSSQTAIERVVVPPIPLLGGGQAGSKALSYALKVKEIAMRNNAATLLAAKKNSAFIEEADSIFREEEFKKLAKVWIKLASLSSSLEHKIAQLQTVLEQRQLLNSPRSPRLSQEDQESMQVCYEGLMKADEEIDDEEIERKNASATLEKNTLAAYTRQLQFFLRGATILEQWIHQEWNEKIHSMESSSTSATSNKILEIEQIEKESTYKKNLSILQMLAANHCEDEDQERCSFFSKVAYSEYDKMISMREGATSDLMEKNKVIFECCLRVDLLSKKIEESQNAAIDSPIQAMTQSYKENCRLTMRIVEQLMKNEPVDQDIDEHINQLDELIKSDEK